MITDEDRSRLAGLAMRALDRIVEDYGDDAELVAASLVFEVKATDEDGDAVWHGNFESLTGNSPNHIAGLLQSTAEYIWRPAQ